MGGMADGNEASEAAVASFVQLFRSLLEEGDVPQQLREGAQAVSDGIFQRFQGRSGTTAVAVRILGAALHWLSVGDSAIFLKRGECVFQLNREHTCLNDLYLEELRREPIQKARAEGRTRTPGGSPPSWASTAWTGWTRACGPGSSGTGT